MSVESATLITQLNSSFPSGGEPRSQGDDHIRLIKSVLKNDAASLTDFANTSDVTKGDALVGVKNSGTGAVARTQHDKNEDAVSVKDFGAVGDGVTDDTIAIQAAITQAKNATKGLNFPAGIYIFNPSSTEDLSGISGLYGTGVTINTASAAANPVFKVEGTRSSVLASAISISEGEDLTPTISTGDLDVNDVLVIISLEALPNTQRAEYYKSGMFVVYANDGAGAITVQPPVPYDFTTSAYLYRIDLQKFTLDHGLTFVGKTSGAQDGFDFIFADADVYSTFTGFNGDVCQYITSRGNFQGKVRSVSGTLGAGVDLADASDVQVSADIHGSFHAVDAGGGTGTWNGSYAGGSSGTSTALSCRFTVAGGFYASTSTLNGTINAHGNTDKVVVGDCQISGSTLNVSARVNDISNVQIEGEQDILLRWGADNNSKDWCDVSISNVRVKRYKQLTGNFGVVEFQAAARARDITIDGLWVEGDDSGNAYNETPILLEGQCRRLSVKNVYPEHISDVRAMYVQLYANTVYEFENIRAADGNRIEFNAQEADVNLSLNNVSVRDGASTSGILLTVETSMNYDTVDVIECQSTNNAAHGLDITKVKTLRIKGGDFSENNASGSMNGINALLTQTLRMSNVDLGNTGRPFDQTDYGAGSTVSVVGCDVTGATNGMDGSLGASCTWEARSANQGDSKDYFRQDDGNLYYYDQSGSAWVSV